MYNSQISQNNPKLLSPATLSFLGDAVFELKVRHSLSVASIPANTLHKMSIAKVCAAAQARAYELLEEVITEDELAVMKRGRNSHSNHVPKNAKVSDYRRASGVEALFGYLFLLGNQVRIDQLFELINGSEEVK